MDRRTREVLGLNALALAGGVALILGLAPLRRAWTPAPVELALGIAWGLVFAGLAWRRTDEAAREAHKTAWFWGATGGLAAGLVALVAAERLAPDLSAALSLAQPFGLVNAGALAVCLAQLLGYGVVWTAWWLRRR